MINQEASSQDHHHRHPGEHELHADDTQQVPGIEEWIMQIKETADKLQRDNASRGDVKLLSTALRELRYCFKVFKAYQYARKVTVFGSARLQPEDASYQAAVDFSRQIASQGYMVITGAAHGIMEAGHVGAGRDMSIGINILLPFEQTSNPIIEGDPKLMHLKYFFTRKLLFVKETDAVALYPGGFGTLDEGFETLTLVQTGKSHLFPILFIEEPGGNFWHPMLDFIHNRLLARKLISPADLSLFRYTDSVATAVSEITTFYRHFHSMRYVHNDLYLRLNRKIPDTILARIREEFSDIVVSGTFHMTTAHPYEANEPHLANLPRLKFHFDRRNVGRLRQLVDLINQIN